MQETEETWIRSPGKEDPLEEEMAMHSSILTGKFHGWGAFGAKVHRVAESDTAEGLSSLTRTQCLLPLAHLLALLLTFTGEFVSSRLSILSCFFVRV